MLQVKNATPFAAELLLLADRSGVDTLYALVKATFAIGDAFGLADEQVPVTLADQHYGDPVTTSIRSPSDVVLEKPGTDVILTGSAWAPGGKPAWHMDVSVAVGPVAKTTRVFGDRAWDAGAAGATVAWVTPFERMPLVWERAYGGRDETEKGPTIDARNPVGTGFRASGSVKPLAGQPLPNVEDPAALISSWKDAPTPAGFAAIGPHWMPRRAYAGTYDDAWQKGRAPYLPHDFDPRFFQVAPAGLVAPRHLQGGEVVDLRGVTPSGHLRFVLPTMRVQVTYRLDQRDESRPGALDTVIIEPDAGRLVMLWRTAFPCDKKALKVREVETRLLEASWGAAA
jgi:hypothetical protein